MGDTRVPPQEREWLRQDLRKTSLPVEAFSHQTLDCGGGQDRNINNASAVRAGLDDTGRMLAVISGNDHQGGSANIKGIHELELSSNVGVNDSRPWNATSRAASLEVNTEPVFHSGRQPRPQRRLYSERGGL